MSRIPLGILASRVRVPTSVQYLVIAGGGGGGGTNIPLDYGHLASTGGGGAGGYRCSVPGESSGGNSSPESPFVPVSGTNYTVTIGGGGGNTGNGSNSQFASIISSGGGHGAPTIIETSTSAGSGGSGGGGSSSSAGYGGVGAGGTTGQGFAGSNASSDSSFAGSGGGAGQLGTTVGGSFTTWDAVDGLASAITGTSVFRGGGGMGGNRSNNPSSPLPYAIHGGGDGGADRTPAGFFLSGKPGAANTGGGGGGQIWDDRFSPGNGGSGFVAIRYSDLFPFPSTIGAGLTYTTATSGGFRIIIFTAGTGIVRWG